MNCSMPHAFVAPLFSRMSPRNVTSETPTTTYTDTFGGKSPTASYVVVAYDAAGNSSAPSSPLSVP